MCCRGRRELKPGRGGALRERLDGLRGDGSLLGDAAGWIGDGDWNVGPPALV